jgi:hypothetical protein
MQLTKEQLDKFKELHKNRFGTELTDAEALDSALNLINLMKVILEKSKGDQSAVEENKKE